MTALTKCEKCGEAWCICEKVRKVEGLEPYCSQCNATLPPGHRLLDNKELK